MLPNLRGVLDRLRQGHQHPVSKVLHTIGVPMILASLPVMPINAGAGGALFVLGWVLLFIGHAIEGKVPAFLSGLRDLVWPRSSAVDPEISPASAAN